MPVLGDSSFLGTSKKTFDLRKVGNSHFFVGVLFKGLRLFWGEKASFLKVVWIFFQSSECPCYKKKKSLLLEDPIMWGGIYRRFYFYMGAHTF